MTETLCILKDVPTARWPRRTIVATQVNAHPIHPSPVPEKSQLNTKRQLLNRLSDRLIASDLPGADLAVEYLYAKYIKNLSVHTIRQSGGVLLSFLGFLDDDALSIFTLTRHNISAFIEYEQDRGLKPLSVIGYLRALYAFIAFLVEQEVLSHQIMKRKIRIQEPDALPKAIPLEDVQLLLDSVSSVRDRALLLLLLRTGMRIGELLEVKLSDIILHDRKILIYLGSKNFQGRAVYFSEDAEHALKHWLRLRDSNQKYLFYGVRKEQLCYSAAWSVMRTTLERAGLADIKYSLHSLRHTFATDMINSGMRIEVLQQLLGHQSIELTMRYARLSDETREKDYFRAMKIIEQGGSDDEPYRVSNALRKVFEEKKLLQPHDKKLPK
ncbi:MAG: tyrosine-type recombinase/integrase [Desulforhopalus sp.]|jgi:site-specific recombinase XerD|nr:tyrosine-type recombinase/integrase [Desulforhopalus sp.]